MNDTPVADDPRLQRALEQLQSVLIPGETLEAWAVQRRLFALGRRRILVAATSGRLIVIARRLLGGFDVIDLRWQDLESVALSVGVFGADLQVRAGAGADLASDTPAGSRVLALQGLRKEPAQAVYRICQAQDQAWREKRRVRELEELRARSGGIQFAGMGGAVAATGAPASSDAIRRLQEARQMLESKLITDAEYESIKARIVSSN
jgi:hypothetical protein